MGCRTTSLRVGAGDVHGEEGNLLVGYLEPVLSPHVAAYPLSGRDRTRVGVAEAAIEEVAVDARQCTTGKQAFGEELQV